MTASRPTLSILAAALLGLTCINAAHAAPVQVKVTVENLSPMDSIAFAPLRVGFHNGTYDAFNIGETANAAIISVAEGGSGADWFPAFMAADPTATLGSVLPTPAGPLLPGASGTATFTVDTSVNPYFTFASMVVPSNDFFIGNDDPMAYRLFDAQGNLAISSILQRSRDVWDAGSEIHDPAAAAFVGMNNLRADQNSVVAFNFAEIAAFNGLTTGPGYVFNSQLQANTDIYRISFEVAPVPEPETYAMMGIGLGLLGVARLRRKTAR